MSLELHISMNESALAPFRAAWESASAGVAAGDGPALIEAARRHHAEASGRRLPPYLQAHIASIGEVIRLLDDRSWPLPEGMRRDLEGALAYFVDESDLIPDSNARFGLLDDAIVIELALAGHQHEWLAWQEFDRFRRDYPEAGTLDRVSWMRLRRDELDAALRHRRRAQRRGGRYAGPDPLQPFVVH